MIRVSRSLSQALDLKESDEIILVQDEDRQNDFYLVRHTGGYALRASAGGELRINCSFYWHKVKEIFKVEGMSIKFKVATTPAKLNELEGYAILTVDPLPLQTNKKQTGKKSETFDVAAFAKASNS